MTNFHALVNRTQTAVNDATGDQWPEVSIEEWLVEAVRAYGRRFKRVRTTTITTTADEHTYDLPADFHAALTIEYPTDEDPPAYLSRRFRRGANFWNNGGYYDILHKADDQNVSQIIISESPAADETITVTYEATHSLDTGTAVTVPAGHHDILVLHTIWSAFKELLSNVQKDTTPDNLNISVIAANTEAARLDWLEAMDQACSERGGKSVIVGGWGADKYDRIY